jgi:DNA repair protein RadC
MNIKSWSEDDRPRERMLAQGHKALSDSELLAIILGSGSKGESAVSLAKRILKDYDNNLNELGKIDVKTLTKKYKGVGTVKAITILACLELGRRRRESEPLEKPIIDSSKDIFKVAYQYLSDLQHEEFWVVLLNRGKRLIHIGRVSTGNLASVSVEARSIVKLALDHFASFIILLHNHPSGNLKPSMEDKRVTADVVAGASFFNITVADHIIVGDGDYFSFLDNDMM